MEAFLAELEEVVFACGQGALGDNHRQQLVRGLQAIDSLRTQSAALDQVLDAAIPFTAKGHPLGQDLMCFAFEQAQNLGAENRSLNAQQRQRADASRNFLQASKLPKTGCRPWEIR